MRIESSGSPSQTPVRFGARLDRLITLPPKDNDSPIPVPPVVAGCWELTTLPELETLRRYVLRWQHVLDRKVARAGSSTGVSSPSAQETVIPCVLAQIKEYKEQHELRPVTWPYVIDFSHTQPLKTADSLLGVAFLNQRSNYLYNVQAKPTDVALADSQLPLKGVGRGLLYALMKRLESLGDLKPLVLDPVVESLPFYKRLFGHPAKHFRPLNQHFPDDPDHVDTVIVDTPGVKAFLKRHDGQYPPLESEAT